MAFQFSNEGTPYYKPVAPEVPQPDNTGAKIISAGTQAGVMGFVHMAVAAQQAKLEQEQMLQKADLAAKELQHKDKWQQMDYEVAKENADTQQEYRKNWFDIYSKNADTDREYKSGLLKAKLQAKVDADNFTTQYAATTSINDSRATKAAADLKLNDETYRNDHPVEWLAALDDFKKRFGTAKVGAAPNIINAFETQAKGMTVPFLPGAEYEQQFDSKNQPILQNGKPTYAWGGVAKNQLPVQMPLRDVVRMWQDPTQRQAVEKGMIAAGHGHIVDQIQSGPGEGGFLGFRRNVKSTTHTPTLDEFGKKILNTASKVKPSQVENEVPPILQQSRPPQWAIKAGVGQEPQLDAAQSEAEHVKALISQHPDLAPQLKGTFYETYPDFDPTYLDSP